MSINRSVAKNHPVQAMRSEMPRPVMIDWKATTAACPGFFSPILRDTSAVVAILNPTAIAYTIVMSDSVIPTVATASGPSFDTKKMSTTAKIDSISISSTMGTESKRIALPSLPVVKSCSVPLTDSQMSRSSCFNAPVFDLYCEDRDEEEYICLFISFSFEMFNPQFFSVFSR